MAMPPGLRRQAIRVARARHHRRKLNYSNGLQQLRRVHAGKSLLDGVYEALSLNGRHTTPHGTPRTDHKTRKWAVVACNREWYN